MKIIRNETWETVLTAGARVVRAYQEMVKASDDLAEELGYNEDYVLRRVLPKSVSERRDGGRVLEWLEASRDEIEARLLAREAAREAAARREALLARLNLSEAERRLLGIAEPE